MTLRNQERLEFQASFTTPAFLGDADQKAQWRTPPFKALLRRWWRIARCAGTRPDLPQLRSQENMLFGHAGETQSRASRVRLRLDGWVSPMTSASEWARYSFGKVGSDRSTVRADLYLGYGPIQLGDGRSSYRGRRSASKSSEPKPERSFIAPGAPRTLTVAYPLDEANRLHTTVRLIQAFGSLGSRSRNGWGSLHLDPKDGTAQRLDPAFLSQLIDPRACDSRRWLHELARPWKEALDTDWCHALGSDDRGLLLWRTKPEKSWDTVITRLGAARKALRAAVDSSTDRKGDLSDLALLAYPVTKHEVSAWKSDTRSANQVVFKVLRLENEEYVGVVVHLPHGLPEPLRKKLPTQQKEGLVERQQRLWPRVHTTLDELLIRLP